MKIDFSTENKAKYDDQYPKLMLEYGERARINIIEQQPTVGFLHTLKAPSIMNGEVVMEPVRQKDGFYKDQVKMDYIGRHMCFGNPNTLSEKMKDPTNCPTCAKANETDAIGAATRAFAMHVIRYKIGQGGFKPQEPFGADLVAWRFSNKVFDQLVDIMGEHGDLRKKDLNLGPCENKNYQKFDIQVGSDAYLHQTDDRKQFVINLYSNNKSEDLSPLIARKVSREMAAEDVDKVMHRAMIASGQAGGSAGGAPVGVAAGAGSSMNLDDMLTGQGSLPSGAPDQSTPEPSQTVTEGVAEDPWASPATDAPAVSEPVAEAPAPAAAPKTDPLDFNSLLEGL